ncbi:unnamed protein product [Zymoseptoria tritici ST99CH_3D7]|uniref:BTB domain-containing protein n=1 Tax=Zymoseptoria tritici (strain ST99CH_3D7) TaxID=1276538 RepID=A0A1X7RPS9_ZYMT9|nr:unnamed protein product [Zymoseptoria tritici ST99CH_3D7]
MANPSTMTPEDGLKIGLANLFKSGDFSDFTIKCGPYHFEVHKAVICAQSEFFKAACKTNSFKEGRENTITLDTSDKDDPSCDDPEAIKQLVHFFYFLDYQVPSVFKPVEPIPKPGTGSLPSLRVRKRPRTSIFSSTFKLAEPAGDGNMLAHAKIFAAAVKYLVSPLQTMAAAKFKTAVASNSSSGLFAETITAVYATTSVDVRELRDIIEETLMENKSLLARTDVETAIDNASGLSIALLRKAFPQAASSPVATGKICGCGSFRKRTIGRHQYCEWCNHCFLPD